MKSRINFTERKRIRRRDFDISVVIRGEGKYGVVSCRLDSYGFPEESPVVAEAYHDEIYQRHSIGTVASSHRITEFDLAELSGAPRLLFRLKVLADDGSGRLLGMADRVPLDQPGTEDDSTSLLPVKAGELGERLWEVEFPPSGPRLVVNNRVTDWQLMLFGNRAFIAGVMPSVLGRILDHILQTFPDDLDPSYGSDWFDKWVRLSERVSGVPLDRAELRDEAFRKDWIDRVTRGYCEYYRLVSDLLAEHS